MKPHKYLSYLTAAICTMALCHTATAQNTTSGYFVDDYTYRFQMNPAYENSKNFIAIPALGNMNVSMRGSLQVRDVIYSVNGQTTTFLNPLVSVDEVMKNIGENNRLGADIKIPILAAGFKAWGGYNTITLSARASVGLKVPGSLFSFLKEGVANQSYDLSGTRAFGTAYGEIALGDSRKINNKLRVGGALKFLIGAGDMSANFKTANLNLDQNDWQVTSEAEINSSMKGLTYKTTINDRTGHEYVDGMDYDSFGLNGFGMAIDLGATYNLTCDWELSMALLDLGFISWNNNQLATTYGEKRFNTDRYVFSADDDSPNSFENQWDNMRDDISAIYELEDAGNVGGRTTMLGATLNIGAKYTLPTYRKLNFGVLNTTRIQGAFSWTDFRFSANIAPVKWLDGGINMAAGSFGVGFGWIVNFHPSGFNFFVGMDHTMGKATKQMVPLSSNASVNLGMNILF